MDPMPVDDFPNVFHPAALVPYTAPPPAPPSPPSPPPPPRPPPPKPPTPPRCVPCRRPCATMQQRRRRGDRCAAWEGGLRCLCCLPASSTPPFPETRRPMPLSCCPLLPLACRSQPPPPPSPPSPPPPTPPPIAVPIVKIYNEDDLWSAINVSLHCYHRPSLYQTLQQRRSLGAHQCEPACFAAFQIAAAPSRHSHAWIATQIAPLKLQDL